MVDRAGGTVLVNGREVKPRRSASAGQFGAASTRSPEDWLWLIVPLPKGHSALQLNVAVPSQQTAVGVYVRGFVPARSDAAPDGDNVFPLFRPDRRAWSQTLAPSKVYAPPAP